MFFICKSTRYPPLPYQGISCDRANIPLGKRYKSREEAEADAEKLRSANPVGWVVVEGGEIVDE